jgi:hypothetical protein
MTQEQLQQEISEIEFLEKEYKLTHHKLYRKLGLYPKYTTSLKDSIISYFERKEKLKEVLRNSEKTN